MSKGRRGPGNRPHPKAGSSGRTNSPLQNVTVRRELLLDFFLTFARFEFALKAAGFVKAAGRPPAPAVKPDWQRFASAIDLATARQDPDCAKAIDFLWLNPPWRETLIGDQLGWASAGYEQIEHMHQVLELVRCVRNNLFHGGKFADEFEAKFRDPKRNELLIRHGLAVLRCCLDLSPAVAARYRDAVL